MGLKNIHLVFISMAIATCIGFGAWCIWRFRDAGGEAYLVAGVGSFGIAAGLTAYGNWFFKKMKGIQP